VHLRDTMVAGGAMKDPQPVVIGHGLLDFRSIISALLQAKYPWQAEFEYEKKEDDRVPGLAESVGYVRGLLAGMTT
jgi:sugar phosphate isomerase/epimerase